MVCHVWLLFTGSSVMVECGWRAVVMTCRADLVAKISHKGARLVRYASPLRRQQAREGRE